MSILDDIGLLMEEKSTTKYDLERIKSIKKMLNLKESESIKTVPDTKLVKMMETYGNPAKEGLKRYAAITEDVDEKKRIAKVLAMLGL